MYTFIVGIHSLPHNNVMCTSNRMYFTLIRMAFVVIVPTPNGRTLFRGSFWFYQSRKQWRILTFDGQTQRKNNNLVAKRWRPLRGRRINWSRKNLAGSRFTRILIRIPSRGPFIFHAINLTLLHRLHLALCFLFMFCLGTFPYARHSKCIYVYAREECLRVKPIRMVKGGKYDWQRYIRIGECMIYQTNVRGGNWKWGGV